MRSFKIYVVFHLASAALVRQSSNAVNINGAVAQMRPHDTLWRGQCSAFHYVQNPWQVRMLQMLWLSEHTSAGAMLEEVDLEAERVWNFIIEREIEAPDRFRAIQSYR